jgi:hypothetical protein
MSRRLVWVVALCTLPSLAEGYAVAWGYSQGFVGKALRDGLDFWAGGFLAWHGHVGILFDPVAYNAFLTGLYGKLPFHFWSYPPNYLLMAMGFGWLPPIQAVLTWEFLSLLLLVGVLRLARLPWVLVLAVMVSPASLGNVLEGQNAALLTALIGGGILLLPTRPLVGGALVGLASIKPQLGVVLPLFLLRRYPAAFGAAVLSAVGLAGLSVAVLGVGAWAGFLHVTTPFMDNVLLSGRPKDFAGGLISVFAACRFLGVHAALAVQGVVTFACVAAAVRCRSAVPVLLLAALGSPYLHVYDLLGTSLAVALLVRERLVSGFGPGESVLYFLAWFGPGLLPWLPQFAHLTPVILLLLLASSARRVAVAACDSSQAPPGLPAL